MDVWGVLIVILHSSFRIIVPWELQSFRYEQVKGQMVREKSQISNGKISDNQHSPPAR